jgi:hypothetical protein
MRHFKIEQVLFCLHSSRQGKGRSIALPVDWEIKIVRGEVLATGSKVTISFLQVKKNALFGKKQDTFTASVTLSDGGEGRYKLAFNLKSPLFSSETRSITLVTDQGAYAF